MGLSLRDSLYEESTGKLVLKSIFTHPKTIFLHACHTYLCISNQSEEERERERGARDDQDSRAMLNLAHAFQEGALDQDPFVQQYRARRMEEMKAQAKLGPQR